MTIPNTFIVGAPRSGTTALHHYLSQHPDIFMSDPKEPHHFGLDLWTDYTEFFRRFRDEELYLSLFANAGDAKAAGEGSVWYLFSSSAAEEIHTFNPDARIVVTLRHPVDYMHSLHQHMRISGEEPIEDFVEALELDRQDRVDKGIELVGRWGTGFPGYRPTAMFARQIRRYQDRFGKDQVHIVLLDDIKADTAAACGRICSFLGVDPDYDADFSPVNESRTVKRRWLHTAMTRDWQIKHRVGKLLPEPVKVRIWRRLHNVATSRGKRGKLDPDVRARLTVEFTDEIRELADVIERDLDHWLS
jgi:hypothetical protein